jgi:hypothetical protein
MLRAMPIAHVCLFTFVGLNSLSAQAPAFEVASVKQLQQPGGSGLPYTRFLGTGGNPIKIAGNRVTLEGTLNILIMAAYNVKDYQVTGGHQRGSIPMSSPSSPKRRERTRPSWSRFG